MIFVVWVCVCVPGYQYSDIGLIGIARLCGPKLRHLNIPDVCINYDAEAKVTTRFLSKVTNPITLSWNVSLSPTAHRPLPTPILYTYTYTIHLHLYYTPTPILNTYTYTIHLY